MHLSPSRTIATVAFLAAVLAVSGSVRAQAKSGLPAAVASQMDAASARFTSAQADLKQEIFTKIVHDTETQIGQIYFLRKNGATQMGMKMLPPDAAVGTPPAQIIEFADGKLHILTTGESQIDVYTAAGKNQSLAETLMNLGFGGSAKDMEKSFSVTDLGPEQVDGVKTEKLDLVASDTNIRNNYSHITIWLDPIRDVSLKQVLYMASGGKPTGDTRTAYYSNIRLNQSVDAKPFALVCKGKCTVINH